MFLTPQAVDDFEAATEGSVYVFNIMSNDLGGTAKSLYAITDGPESDLDSTEISDLQTKDVAGVYEATALGAQAAIVNGQIVYDTSTSALMDSLAEGQQLTDTITYAIRLANGTLSLATLTITVTGTNDAPVIAVAGPDTASASLAETNAGLSSSGTLTVTDADTSDSVSSAVSGLAVTGTSGGLTTAALQAMLTVSPALGLAANTGDANNLGWGFNSGSQAFDFLSVGQSLVLTYTITSTDTNGATDTQDVTITITITGTADGVTIPAVFIGVDPNDNNGEATGAGGVVTDAVGNNASILRGGSGNDTISALPGNDTVYAGAGADSITGDNGTDLIYGGSGNDTISAGQDIDAIYGGSGNDVIIADSGNDNIYGGYGADTLTGNANNDSFIFLSTYDTGDTITDFVSGTDRINLIAIDANTSIAGDQAFVFGGTTATANGVWYAVSGGNLTVDVDTNGNTSDAELVIYLTAPASLLIGDVIL